MNRNDALRILGLGREASVDEARRAYREQVKLWHPDRYSDNSALKALALRNVQDANRAWAYLRARLPRSAPRPHHQDAASTAPVRSGRQPMRTGPSPRQAVLMARLRRGVHKLSPLMERMRRIPRAIITAWLKDDPKRRYRPWYRYSRDAGNNGARRRKPTFSQTLREVMKTRSRGSLPLAATYDREQQTRRRGSPSSEDQMMHRESPGAGAIDPIERSRKL